MAILGDARLLPHFGQEILKDLRPRDVRVEIAPPSPKHPRNPRPTKPKSPIHLNPGLPKARNTNLPLLWVLISLISKLQILKLKMTTSPNLGNGSGMLLLVSLCVLCGLPLAVCLGSSRMRGRVKGLGVLGFEGPGVSGFRGFRV